MLPSNFFSSFQPEVEYTSETSHLCLKPFDSGPHLDLEKSSDAQSWLPFESTRKIFVSPGHELAFQVIWQCVYCVYELTPHPIKVMITEKSLCDVSDFRLTVTFNALFCKC